MDVKIKSAETKDLTELCDLWVALVESQRNFGSHIEGAPSRSAAREVLGSYIAGDKVAVARPATGATNGRILGFVMYYQETGLYEQNVNRGIIENVYVIPDARRNGIGSQLLDYAESTLANRGVDVVAIAAMAANDAVIDWYEDRGYEPYRIILERDLNG